MKTIMTIKQRDIEPGFSRELDVEFRERLAARAVLFDDNGRVVLLHVARFGYYKLPGGGVEAGEDMALALARELKEEVGASAVVVTEVGRVEEWREFGDQDGLHQISDAFLAKVDGEIGEPSFTEKELNDGFSVFWAQDIDEAIELVGGFLGHDEFGVRFMAMRDSCILKEAKKLIQSK